MGDVNMQNFSKSQSSSSLSSGSSSGGAAGKGSISGTIATIFDQEGPLGFYKGMKTKIFQSVFAASLLYMCKEELKKGARTVVKKMA